MASFKLILWKHNVNENGENPVYIRATVSRKTKYQSTGIYLNPSHWDEKSQNVKKSASNYSTLHLFFEKQKSDMQNRILDLNLRGIKPTLENIWEATQEPDRFNADLILFIEDWLGKQKKNDVSVKTWKSHFNRLKKFSPQINMHTTTGDFLERYLYHLEHEVEGIKSYNTAHNHLKTLRKFWNLARKKKLTDNYPFTEITIKSPKYAQKPYLNKQERERLMALTADENIPPYLYNTLIHFLIACYSGLRYSDWNKCLNVVDDNLVVEQKKGDKGLLVIPIGNRLAQLIAKRMPHWRVFSDQKYRLYLKELMLIAQIDKHVGTHTARHTFAMMCLNEAEMSFEMVASLLGDEINTVKKHYAHYHTASKRKALSKLDDL